MPLIRQVLVEVSAIYSEAEDEVNYAFGGDNVRIRLRGIEDEEVSPGFMLTSPAKPVHAVRRFEAQLAILDSKNIICAGYSAVMHVHTLAEEVQLTVRCPLSPQSMHKPNTVNAGLTSLLRQENWSKVKETASICQERFASANAF